MSDTDSMVWLAMVMLAEADLPDPDSVAGTIRAWTGARAEPEGVGEERFTLGLGGVSVAVQVIGSPVPAGELDAACAASWHWPEAARALRGHRAHLLVAGTGGGDALDRALAVTHAAGACAEVAGALGVSWGAAGLVHSAPDFAEEAAGAARDAPAVHLWVRYALERRGTTSTVRTHGLDAFGLPEIEIRDSRRGPEDLLEVMTLAAGYTLEHGAVLGDGDSFGRSDDETIVVRHRPAPSGSGRSVMVLEF